ncbi:Short-chain dehydrogenase [Lampropedia hyalina DSM 16112]|uniref:Short-chain dehydrogenase n=1 Tax=Lampropedia hyalina DSM 16112 TaxID=1122156 RepID=A0A1M4TDA9_9BURK|nr:SDR family oxidoreductase [Lampropedia hyalina]SHE42423.1 Short-chain dehydrogenase [Lampropedia hyalina DSM 16112]
MSRPAAPRSPLPLVFITGASSGLGQALAAHYAAQGWRLALVARRVEAMQAWAQARNLPPAQYAVYGADVSQPASIQAATQHCLQQQGVPDVVIANAGISHGVDSGRRGDLAVMQRIWATNNLGMAATFQPFIQPMQQRGSGTLVGIASVAGVRGLPGHGGYCSSKAGVIAYCESLRGELRGTGVKVTTISPGFIATPMTADNPFPMPFLMPADRFAAKAYAVIEAQRSYCVIPWQMGWVARLLRVLPDAVFDRALAGRGRKPRSKEGDSL